MYRILLKNATYFEFGIEIWIKNCLRDYSGCYLSGSALSDTGEWQYRQAIGTLSKVTLTAQ